MLCGYTQSFWHRLNGGSIKNDLLLIAMQEMDTEIKAKRREWEKQGGREDQIDRSNYLDGFFHAWKIANRVYNKGAKNTDYKEKEDDR